MPPDTTDWLSEQTDEFSISFSTHGAPLSNWSANRIRLWGKIFPTAEHAYQYKKYASTDMLFAESIRKSTSPWLAKKLAWSRLIDCEDWNSKREKIMLRILEAKYNQHEDVRIALAQTGNRAILEVGSHPDNFWGVGRNYTGSNTLGKFWMKIRDREQSNGI